MIFSLVQPNKGLNRIGFTLAEVLITLGIIGVVAAMTIPNLMSKIQKQIYVTSLKKNYAAMTQGFKMMLAEEEADDFGGVSSFIEMGKSQCKIPNDIDDAKCNSLWAGLARHMKLSPTVADKTRAIRKMTGAEQGWSYVEGTKYMALPSGMWIYSANFYKTARNGDAVKIAELGGHMYTLQGDFTVDINGPANPNKLGRDVFMFKVDSKGQIYAAYSKDYAIYDGQLVGLLYWPGYNRCGRGNSAASIKTSTGEGCAARIMERGWIMDY